MNIPELKERTNERFENNFDLLRFLAAIFVIISHSFKIALNSSDPLESSTGVISMGTLGVAIFFTISGYLILKSWDKKRDIISFFKNRILRIFPALTCVVLISIFILGPVTTVLSWRDYFTNPGTWKYLYNIVLNIQFILPGVFENNPYPYSVNGSLWTLPIEFFCYILVCLLGLCLVYRNKYNLLIFFLVQSFIFVLFPLQLQKISPFYFPFTNLYIILSLLLYFSGGMIFFAFKDMIKLNYKILLSIFLMLVITYLFAKNSLCSLMMIIFISYFTMYIANFPIKQLHFFGKYGDFSYGLYIFAFPIQQTIAFYFKGISVLFLIIFSIVSTLLVAIISWNLIENPCLKLKNKNLSTFWMREHK